MPRPRQIAAVTTLLGSAMLARRGPRPLTAAAKEVGVTYSVMSRLECGFGRPSADTALKLAKWLGWTMEEVMEAAGKAASPDAPARA